MSRQYRYLDLIMVSFVTVLLCSNLIGTSKVADFFGFKYTAAVLFFPVSYIFGDVLTEVYGYNVSRRVIWAGFAAMGFASLVSAIVVMIPASDPEQQRTVERVFGQTWRIVAASMVAYFVGEFVNSFILARMKVATAGRHLWTRTIGSTVAGELVDSLIFYPLAFLGTWPTSVVFSVAFTNYAIKVMVEAVMTPLTYVVVGRLKKAEAEDYFDRDTNFSPFKLE